MFLANKYTRWYTSLCENARGRAKVSGEHELHHIIPKALGGAEVVALTFREHFLCHWLLTKMLPPGKDKRKMLYALHSMSRTSRHTPRRVSAWQYEVSRRAQSQVMARRTVSNETREKLSRVQIGRIPWNKGAKGLQKNPIKGMKGHRVGWHHSPEARQNISLKQLGRPKRLSEEGRQRLRENGRRTAIHLRETGALKGRVPWNKGRVFVDPEISREKARLRLQRHREKKALLALATP